MASDFSFDIVSDVDLQIIDDVVNVAMKEITNRFDFKNTSASIEFNRKEKEVTFLADSEFQLNQVKDILVSKLAKRNISSKVFAQKKQEEAFGGKVRAVDNIICGVDKEVAKKIVKDIKDTKLKIQSSIQDEKIRVSGKSKDDLQSVMNFLKEQNYPIHLDFINYR